MNELAAKIEAILFLSSRPVSFSKLAKMTGTKEGEMKEAVETLMLLRNTDTSGIHVVVADGAAELSTNPNFTHVLSSMSKEETEGELTRPQLETLTVIAYRSPVTRAEIEYIRGVNCSLILRNLLVRGLIIEKDDKTRMQPVYTVSTEFLRHLGLARVEELPDYGSLSKHAKIDELLAGL